MKVIFLDVDGVLNNSLTDEYSPEGYTGISDVLVENLAKLVKLTKAKIVLTSDWKSDWENKTKDGVYLAEKLKKQGLEISERTYESYPSRRGEGIRTYLENNDVDKYVILDDTEFGDFTGELEKRFVNTNYVDGLSIVKVQEAIKILNKVKGEE